MGTSRRVICTASRQCLCRSSDWTLRATPLAVDYKISLCYT